MKTISTILSLWFLLGVASVQAQSDEGPMVNSILQDMQAEADSAGMGLLPLDEVAAPGSSLAQDTLLQQAYRDAMVGYYQYRSNGYTHRSRVFGWQLQSSKIIFFVVILLVLTGMIFSGIQFKRGLEEAKAPVTELEASVKGVKVSSPILGVIILVLSLAFFYLYLTFVYPIQEIF